MTEISSVSIWSATPTPFLEDGTLDEESLQRVVEQHLGIGADGMFLGGTCGEGPFMPVHQLERLVSCVHELAAGRIHVAAQVSDTSPARVMENMRRLTDAGADSLVIAPPFVIAPCSHAFLMRYFSEALDAATLPMGLYIRPIMQGMELSPKLWEPLVAHPAVHFIKDSSMDAENALLFLAAKRRRPELQVMTGFEFDVIKTVQAGYDGCLMGSGIFNVRLIRQVAQAVRAGDLDEARRWQAHNNQFLRDLFRPELDGWMAGLKYALTRAGIFRTPFAHLCFPIDDADRKRIDAALEREKDWIFPSA